MHLLSVVIPTRNRASLVRRAINSGLAEGVNVVVVDDASSDHTAAVVRGFAESGVNYLRLPENRGPCYARNVGVGMVERGLILFLDDDDELLPGAGDAIRSVAGRHPGFDLYLHNCLHPDGKPSLAELDGTAVCTYDDWLAWRFAIELKPVVTRELFNSYSYDDTGAGGEHLLWTRVIRDRGAVVSKRPIVRYNNDASVNRLTSAAGMLTRAPENAAIADRLLSEFGADIRRSSQHEWARRMVAAATYHLLSGDRERARGILSSVPSALLPLGMRHALVVLTFLPAAALQTLFLLYRREFLATVKRRLGRRASTRRDP